MLSSLLDEEAWYGMAWRVVPRQKNRANGFVFQAVYTRQAGGLVFYKCDPEKTHADHQSTKICSP